MIFIAAFVLPANEGLACGDASKKEEVGCEETTRDKSCCSADEASCCDKHSDSEKDCGGDCDQSACHCSPATSPTLLEIAEPYRCLDFYISKKLWPLNKTAPELIYLAIWAPPKISRH